MNVYGLQPYFGRRSSAILAHKAIELEGIHRGARAFGNHFDGIVTGASKCKRVCIPKSGRIGIEIGFVDFLVIDGDLDEGDMVFHVGICRIFPIVGARVLNARARGEGLGYQEERVVAHGTGLQAVLAAAGVSARDYVDGHGVRSSNYPGGERAGFEVSIRGDDYTGAGGRYDRRCNKLRGCSCCTSSVGICDRANDSLLNVDHGGHVDGFGDGHRDCTRNDTSDDRCGCDRDTAWQRFNAATCCLDNGRCFRFEGGEN